MGGARWERTRWRSLCHRERLSEQASPPSVDRTSLLQRAQLTEGSGAGPGGRAAGRAGARSLRRGCCRHLRQVREDLPDDAPLGDDRDDPHGRAAWAEERIDLVDTADQRGPALPELLAFGRVGLGGNRETHAVTLGSTFRCVVSNGIIPGLRLGRLSLDPCPPSFAPHHRGVVAVVPDGVLSWLLFLHRHIRARTRSGTRSAPPIRLSPSRSAPREGDRAVWPEAHEGDRWHVKILTVIHFAA
jgi:hypothetical protein